MIIRILGHGQWVMEPEQLLSLNEADEAVERAVEANDAEALRAALASLNAGVRSFGTEVPDEVIAESDLVLPDEDASVEEVRALLDSISDYYGLIPDAGNFEDEVDSVETTDVEPGRAPEAAASEGEVSTADEVDVTGDAPPTDEPIDATPQVSYPEDRV